MPTYRQDPALFSWALSIGGSDIKNFGDMEMSWSTGGYGTSGIVSVQFKFAIPSAEHNVNAFSGGDTVILTGAGGSWTFYVRSKSDDGDGKINFVCYDRAGFVDCAYPTDKEDGTASGSTKYVPTDSSDKNEEKIYLSTVLDKIASTCGYSSCLIDGTLLDLLPQVLPSSLEGKICRNILDDIASALVGYWAMQSASGLPALRFFPYGAAESDIPVKTEQHEMIRKGSYFKYSGVAMTGGSERYVSNSSSLTADYALLEINTSYASLELCEAVNSRVGAYIYAGWVCDNAILTDILLPPGLVDTAGSGQLRANHCTMSLSSQGIFASLGAVFPDETWQYKGKVYRELDSRLKVGMSYGNIKITNKGIKFVFVDENKKSGKE